MTKQKFITYFLAIFFLIILDQASKNFLISYLKTQPNYILEVLPILEFVYAWNYGISFGLFREYYQYSNAVFLVLNSAIILYLFYHHMSFEELEKYYSIYVEYIEKRKENDLEETFVGEEVSAVLSAPSSSDGGSRSSDCSTSLQNIF